MKNISNNVVGQSLMLEFETVFSEESPLSVEEYLQGGDKNIVLKLAAAFLSIRPHDSKFNDNKFLIFTIFFSSGNSDFAQHVYTAILRAEKKWGEVEVINNYSSLKLFETFIINEGMEVTQTPEEFERNLFKAYLVLNSKFTKAQMAAYTNPSLKEEKRELQYPVMVFTSQYPISDKTEYNIFEVWLAQTIKAIYLFRFLEANAKTLPILNALLAYFNCSNWVEFLKRMMPLSMSAIEVEKEGHTDIVVTKNEQFVENCNFIEKLVIQQSDELEEYDFLTLRLKPFYKIDEGAYRVIFNLFVVEKLFKGIYFLLRQVNKQLPKGQKMDDGGLRSTYCYEFSEKTLTYEILNLIYPGKNIKFSGHELDNMGIVGAPDYYIRKGKNILLFESKDFLIRADKKASFDYDIFEPELMKTLYCKVNDRGKQENGAVMQLIHSIRRILKKDFSADKNYNYREVFIYPIIIIHDHQYDTAGLNKIVNDWFQEELKMLESEEGFFIYRVKPLVIVNIDSLIIHQVGLAEDIPLHKVLDLFGEETKEKPYQRFKTQEDYRVSTMSKLIPFSMFISKYFSHKSIRPIS